jgi:hypothetical protein
VEIPKITFNIAITLFIALIWVIFDSINLHFGAFLYAEKYLYAIYWLAGFRILAIILFGYAGFFGVWLGYALGGALLRDFEPMDAISLGLLSSSATLIAYRYWCKWIAGNEKFQNVSFLNLFYLMAMNAILTAALRYSYLYFFKDASSTMIALKTFAANISGAILFMYALKLLFIGYKKFRPTHS